MHHWGHPTVPQKGSLADTPIQEEIEHAIKKTKKKATPPYGIYTEIYKFDKAGSKAPVVRLSEFVLLI